jgi:hypothetical protein
LLSTYAGHHRNLLQTRVNGVDIVIRVKSLDETGAIGVALKLKNIMASGEVQVMLLEVFPASEVDFVYAKQPSVTRGGEPLLTVPIEALGLIKARGGRGSVLEGAIRYEWTVDQNSRLEMIVTARTQGWVGVGFAASPQGLMLGADLIIGTFEDGRLRMGDYYVASERALGCPSGVCLDTKLEEPELMVPGLATEERVVGIDNLLAWSGEQNDGETTIVFSRLLHSDDPYDRSIAAGRTTVLLADGKQNGLSYHGANKVHRTMPSTLPYLLYA